jgi:carbon storage regulator
MEGRNLNMLVLSRQRDESIIIGDNIVVTVVDIQRDKVRLGIEAPKNIPVHRQEVYETIQRENESVRGLENQAESNSSQGISGQDERNYGNEGPNYHNLLYQSFDIVNHDDRGSYLTGGFSLSTKAFSGKMKLDELYC